MFKFTNGIVVFDKKTRDEFIKHGFKLEKEEKEVQVENTDNNEVVEEQPRTNKKKTNKI